MAMSEESFHLAATIVELFCIVVATVIACAALRTWQSEMLGRRRFELATKTLCLAYRAEVALQALRSPLYRSMGEELGPNDFWSRFKRDGAPFQELQSLKFEVWSVFGKREETEKPFKLLNEATSQLKTAARSIESTIKAQREVSESQYAKLEGADDGTDEVSKLMKEAIEQFENILSKYCKYAAK